MTSSLRKAVGLMLRVRRVAEVLSETAKNTGR